MNPALRLALRRRGKQSAPRRHLFISPIQTTTTHFKDQQMSIKKQQLIGANRYQPVHYTLASLWKRVQLISILLRERVIRLNRLSTRRDRLDPQRRLTPTPTPTMMIWRRPGKQTSMRRKRPKIKIWWNARGTSRQMRSLPTRKSRCMGRRFR
jgi:hypothetical protein